MVWAPNFKKGVDLPVWDWLSFYPTGVSQPGTGNAYDGVRYIYWAIQSGTGTAGSANTSQLWRFDTWTEGWQFLATLTSGNQGMDVEYDVTRNLVIVSIGAALTAWQVFNLNTVAVTFCNQSLPAWTLTTITLVLPATSSLGGSLTMPDDYTVGDSGGATPVALDNGVAAGTSTATSIVDSSSNPGSFGPGMVGCQVRFTSGALAGQAEIISAVPSPTTLTTSAFTGTPAVGDTFVVEVPQATATAGAASTLTDANANWTVNFYSNSDVVIISGTGAGQRRRIASNTGTVLTLAAAVTGNARTGNWITNPDATSVYRIIPSSDFLYYQPGSNGTAFYKIDVVQTTGTAWSGLLAAVPGAVQGGGNTVYPQAYAPFQILCLRGNGTKDLFAYNIGLNTWVTLTTFAGAETFNTGASAALIHGHRKLFIAKEGSQRCYVFDLTTGILEPAGFVPYATPGGVDGHRSRYVKTPDGVEWMYHMRAGGQEFFRVPLEWVA